MNIFYTNIDPVTCADEHCVVHTRKMIVEYAQMLSTVRQSSENFMWLYEVSVK